VIYGWIMQNDLASLTIPTLMLALAVSLGYLAVIGQLGFVIPHRLDRFQRITFGVVGLTFCAFAVWFYIRHEDRIYDLAVMGIKDARDSKREQIIASQITSKTQLDMALIEERTQIKVAEIGARARLVEVKSPSQPPLLQSIYILKDGTVPIAEKPQVKPAVPKSPKPSVPKYVQIDVSPGPVKFVPFETALIEPRIEYIAVSPLLTSPGPFPGIGLDLPNPCDVNPGACGTPIPNVPTPSQPPTPVTPTPSQPPIADGVTTTLALSQVAHTLIEPTTVPLLEANSALLDPLP
jgi:hypothetical protein